MAKTTEVAFIAEEAQFLLEQSTRMGLPQELGEEKFSVADQSIANDEMAALVLALKGHSPWIQGWGKERLGLFGDKTDWAVKKDDEGNQTCEHLEPGKTYKVRFSDEAVNGAMWVLFLSLYPSVKMGDRTHRPVSAAIAAQVCWPIAKKLGKATALRSFLKMDKTRSRVWASDEVSENDDQAGAA